MRPSLGPTFLDPNCLTLLEEFLEKVDFEKKTSAATKILEKLPKMQIVVTVIL